MRFRTGRGGRVRASSRGQLALQDADRVPLARTSVVLTTPGRVIFNARSSARSSAVHADGERLADHAVHQPDAREARDRRVHRRPRRAVRRARASRTVLDTIKTLAFRFADAGRHHHLEERHRHPARRRRRSSPATRARCAKVEQAVRARPDHRGRAPRAHRRDLDGGDRRGRRRDEGEPRRD